MRDELDKKLCAKYPKIFADRNENMKNTAMCWGFECGDGWYWLIDTLCEHIQGYIDGNPHLHIHQVVAVQVKEKFGGLRFYYNGGDQEIEGMVSHTEFLSYLTCEVCGSHENIGYTSGWITTICKPCFDSAKASANKPAWKSKEDYEKEQDEIRKEQNTESQHISQV